jgi:hypothetical protein
MSGKYDPPEKAKLLAENPRIDSTCELMVAAAEAKYPQKGKSGESASRAGPTEDVTLTAKRGRKSVVTPERVQLICEALARGESETAACLTAGIGLTAWNTAKRCNADLRGRIASARDDWARLRHARHAAALYESQWARSAARKAKRPQPTYQANLVMWHLITRVPLNFVAIPESEVKTACEKFNIPLETWRRQERAFRLMLKVYAKRAAIRGQQPTVSSYSPPQFQDWPSDNETDEYSY